MALVGTLRDLSLPNLVQLQCSEQKHAQVTLTHAGQQGTLVFVDGELTFASVGNQAGEAAVYELLTWDDGEFRVDTENVRQDRNINLPWNMLMLEGLRLADEARAEHDLGLEKKLRELQNQFGLRAAIVTTGSGLVKASTNPTNANADAALAAFVAGRAEAISSFLGLGSFLGMNTPVADEKIVLEKLNGNYVCLWFQARATPEQIKTVLNALGIAR